LTNDTAARIVAQHLSIRVHGTLGVLLRAIRRCQRSAGHVEKVLRSIPEHSSLHIKPALLEEVIEQVRDLDA
jgi:predicted nucleic acid-binding protein